ncbi:MAG: hypothetical protein RLZZ350_545 [Verrucomicrobiota bacterium]|jgi:LysM repeat protein
MNPTNPFESQTSAQEQLKKSRARLQLAVIGGFGVCLVVASLMLLQGCKREEPVVEPTPVDTNAVAVLDTNLPSLDAHTNITLPPINFPAASSNSPVINTAVTPTVTDAPVVTGGSEYAVAKGDSFYTIAKKHGVSTKAIADANPGVDSKKLKVGQKLNVPTATASVKSAEVSAPHATSEGSYKVKSGDTLMKIAKAHGTTYKALKAANGLTTDRIKVGQKLTIPGKAVAAPAEPVVETAPAVAAPVVTLPPVVMPTPAK